MKTIKSFVRLKCWRRQAHREMSSLTSCLQQGRRSEYSWDKKLCILLCLVRAILLKGFVVLDVCRRGCVNCLLCSITFLSIISITVSRLPHWRFYFCFFFHWRQLCRAKTSAFHLSLGSSMVRESCRSSKGCILDPHLEIRIRFSE